MDKLKIIKVIVLSSSLPMGVHTTQHLLAGSYFPTLFVLALVILILSLWSLKLLKRSTIIKVWCFLLISYGLIRTVLVGLILVAESGVPSGIYYQLDSWYFITTIFCLLTGIWLLRTRKKPKF